MAGDKKITVAEFEAYMAKVETNQRIEAQRKVSAMEAERVAMEKGAPHAKPAPTTPTSGGAGGGGGGAADSLELKGRKLKPKQVRHSN